MVKTSPATLDNYAETLCPRIEAALDGYSDLGEGCPIKLRKAIRYSLLAPGKRLRPMLVLLAAEACDGSIEDALPAACAVEMVHAYSLIHDDLPAMDDDDLRRGLPTCHKAFDEATAILAGDALLALAFEVLAKHVHPPALAAACCAALAEAAGACNLVGGQADDMAGTHFDEGLELLESIDRRKTGALIHVSLRLGGITAKADARQLSILDQYGRHVGLAFQIIDDLLDVNCSEQSLGKRVGKDARQGKLTFPGVLGIDQSAQYAGELINKACEALEPLGSRAAGLDALARYVLKRNR
ncbi:MAG: polyprenyl synthetase family protein [Thermoguttaceae bacterium]|jgi:geranylgeranyl diphosphate synthase type II